MQRLNSLKFGFGKRQAHVFIILRELSRLKFLNYYRYLYGERYSPEFFDAMTLQHGSERFQFESSFNPPASKQYQCQATSNVKQHQSVVLLD